MGIHTIVKFYCGNEFGFTEVHPYGQFNSVILQFTSNVWHGTQNVWQSSKVFGNHWDSLLHVYDIQICYKEVMLV